MHLHDAAKDYLAFLKHEQRATATTYKCYQSGLNAFLRWLEANGHPNPTTFDLNTPALRKYLYFHSERGLRPRTLRGKFHPIKALIAYLMANDALKADPCAGLTMPRKDPARRLLVSEAEVRALLTAVERLASVRRVSLCRAILCVLVYSGLRRQELLDLTVSDYDASEGALFVRHGKGDKARTVFLPDVARHALDDWLTNRVQDSPLTWLFLLDKTRRVGQDALAAIVEEIKAAANLRGAENIKPHSLRHFYASHLLQAGADLESIRVLLGHSDLRTTQVYIHADRQQLKKVGHLAALQAQEPPAVKPAIPEGEPSIRLSRQREREARPRRIAR